MAGDASDDGISGEGGATDEDIPVGCRCCCIISYERMAVRIGGGEGYGGRDKE